jgi:predicted nucleotidyltransferase/DNA-binding XRE family transcriptional regulator
MNTEQAIAAGLLREARLRANLSQTELARRAGVAQSVISAYESGHREPSLATLTRMVKATGHTIKLNLEENSMAVRGLPDSPIGRRLRRNRSALLDLAASHGAENLRVFGSVARGENTVESDVDMVADLPSGIGLFELGVFERELSKILKVKVDLVPSDGLRPRVRDEVDAEAIPL